MRPSTTRAMVLVWVALRATLVLAADTATDATTRMPQDISSWDYSRTPDEKQFQRGRFWDRAFLRQAVRASHWDRSMGQVLHKLRTGQRIVVMAMGSSISADYGGHFQRRPDSLEAVVPSPAVFHRPEEKEHGFLQMFMTLVNHTYPHPGHLLYNAAVPATSFYGQATASCMEAMLPNVTVDLLIAEHVPRRLSAELEFSDRSYMHHTQELEQFIWRIAAHYKALDLPTPPYVFLKPLTFHYNTTAFDECALYGCPVARCAHFQGPYSQPDRNASLELHVEGRMHDIAKHYGQTLVSFNYMLHAARLNGTLGHMSDCELGSRLYLDTLHPSRLGQVLLADLLTNLLADAEADPLSTPPLLSTSTTSPLSLRGGGSPPQGWVTSGVPETAGASSSIQLAFLRRGVRVEVVGQPTAQRLGALGDAAWQPRTMPLQALTAAGRHAWRMRCYGEAKWDSDMNIVQREGWVHVMNQTHVSSPSAVPKRKPGWVGSAVGATLHIQVDTTFASDDTGMPANVTVALLLLQSYEHMGTARVACVKHCVCPSILIDAHNREEVSISVVHDLPGVSLHPQCVLEVKILSNSSSPRGEHKFKLVQVMVKSQLMGLARSVA